MSEQRENRHDDVGEYAWSSPAVLQYSCEPSANSPGTARRPVGRQRLTGCRGQQEWRCKVAHFDHKLFQIVPLFGEPAPADERAPLERPRGILIVDFAESHGYELDRRSPVPEGRADRRDQQFGDKRVHAGQKAEVVVIFHPAVEKAEFAEGFELLGDDGFARIGVEYRCWQIEQRRILKLNRRRHNDVPKSDVDLHQASIAYNLTRTPS